MSTVTAIKYGEEEETQEKIAPYELDFGLTHKVNLGQQQNEIPLLQQFQFRNNTQEELKDLCISITSDPAFLQDKQWRVESVKSGGIFTTKKKDVNLIRSFLAECEETIRATVKITVTAESPKREIDLISSTSGRPPMLISTGNEMNLSTSRGASAGAGVSTCT